VAARRAFTLPAYLAITLLLTVLAPVLLPLVWLLGHHPRLRGALPTLGFALGYLWCEVLGVLASLAIWMRYPRSRQAFLEANYRLQCWWASTLKRIAERLFHLSFEVSGEEALTGPGAILMPRHTSIADTLIPMVYYAIPMGIRLRYVLKRELLLDPCLDIVGNRLPNYFVDRGGEESARAAAGVAELTRDMARNEGLLLYPEGTRFSPGKHSRLEERWRHDPERRAQLDRWQHVLPPRTGGTMAALAANPGRDLVFCAHVGFEGASHFRHLVKGAWCGARIRIHFWRVPFEMIPHTAEERLAFLFDQWDRMDRWVSLHGD
jgi:1-acyl-sn-glycerol-3-phosphate acyltransferase